MLYLLIFFILLVIYTVLFWIDIKAALEYIRNEKNEWVVIYFYTLDGVFRYKREIPLVNAEGDRIKFKLVKGQSNEMRTGTQKREKLTPMDIYYKYLSTRIYLKDHRSLFESIRNYINKKDVHVEMNIKIRQGTGNAAHTGLICGLLWEAAGILITYLSRYFKTFKKNITITPCFDKSILEVDAYCIFHVKLVHIIVVLIKVFRSKYMIKIKKTIGGEVCG